MDEKYPEIVSEVMSSIIVAKTKFPDVMIIDLIEDFCIKRDVPVELIADAITDDEYFKSFIASDYTAHQNKSVSEW